MDEECLKQLQSEKRAAYSPGRSGNEDPQLHDLVLDLQGRVLSHILHPTVMTRLVDSSQYGNTYMPNEVLDDLYNAIFIQNELPNTFIMNLQSKYVDSLINALDDSDYDEISRAAIYTNLKKIRSYTSRSLSTKDSQVRVHYNFLNWKLDKALNN